MCVLSFWQMLCLLFLGSITSIKSTSQSVTVQCVTTAIAYGQARWPCFSSIQPIGKKDREKLHPSCYCYFLSICWVSLAAQLDVDDRVSACSVQVLLICPFRLDTRCRCTRISTHIDRADIHLYLKAHSLGTIMITIRFTWSTQQYRRHNLCKRLR